MKKLNLLLAVTSLLMSGGLFACTDDSSSSTTAAEKDEKIYDVQYIIDNTFQEGFLVNPANGLDNPGVRPSVPEDRWQGDVKLTYKDDANPSWLVAQHGDIYSLNDKYNKMAGGTPDYEDGYYTYYDESKKLSVNPTTGSLYLELNTSKEYLRPRENKEEWCHILLNGGFENPIMLKEIDKLTFTIDLEMKKFEDHMDGQANSSVHATQFLMYLVITSEAAQDANDFFWFGIPFFDNRYPNGLPESGMVDAGGAGATSKFIYGMPSADYIPGGLKLNEKASVSIDIREYIGYALVKAQEMGYFTNSTINDLVSQSMNIGFEIPGTYDCGIEISNFSLTGHYPNGFTE